MAEQKVPRERVLLENRDGAPHITIDDGGTLHHYASGCAVQAARSSGPAQVASDAFRDGWDAIWGAKRGGAPS